MSDKGSWYVIKEIPKPPYEVTWSGPYASEAAAYEACPDDAEFGVWPRPAEDRIEAECEPSSQGEWG